MDIQQMRAHVSDLYDGPTWKKRVSKMPELQVIAIFLDKIAEPEEEPPESFVQMKLF